MEMLRLAGYTDYEKVEIAKRFLIPREAQQNGISVDQLQLPGQLIATIIREYTREAGVRELQRVISRIARFIAVRQARGNDRELVYTPELVREILGPKQIFLEQLRTKWGPGISTGLAWTDSGGDIIYIETSLLPKRQNELKITGHLGEIMRESIGCAISYIWAHPEFHSDREDLRDSGLHIHIPAGAIPKDGPSAGAAIAVALASLYTNQPARKDLAMTGELTLSGLILPVGGIKEKVLAAHRAGIQEVILPRANDRDLRELPDQVLSEIHFCFVEDINQVLRESLPALFNYDRSNADHEPSSLGWH
jgi:ATP-dependent Lon protease